MAASLSAAVDAPADRARILLVDDQPARLLTYEAILAPLVTGAEAAART